MCAAPFVWGACLEDYSWRYSLPKSADVLKGPRQRLYGILFMEKPSAMNKNKSRYVITSIFCNSNHGIYSLYCVTQWITTESKDFPGFWVAL